MTTVQAGRELDALIAEKVMGLRKGDRPGEWENPDGTWHCDTEEIPTYSTDIAAAFLVVDKIESGKPKNIQGQFFSLNGPGYGPGYYYANKTELGQWVAGWMYEAAYEGSFYDSNAHAYADTAALAICLAALKAVGYEVAA